MKKVYIGTGVGIVVIIVIGLCAWFIPQTSATNYKNVVGTDQPQLNDSVGKLTALLSKDSFTKEDVEPNTIRSDVASGNEAVKDYEAKRDAVASKLTSLPAIPLVDWQPAYHKAKQLKSSEQAYVNKANAYVGEMKATLAYFDKTADLTQKSNNFGTAIDDASQAESTEDFAKKIDAALKDFEPVVSQAKAITPPASLKESHEYQITSVTQLIDLLKQLSAAVKAEDETKATQISEKLTTLQKESTDKQAALQANFIRSSPLRTMSNELADLNREITKQQAAI